ncbi:uncharacterized protein [Solanum lycopersicum]|uniref:uncharacterized protein n=1 Tax=Solanum lycopersicum TaxID=4081 RepID=UPI0037480C9A
MDFMVGLPKTRRQHDSIWVILDRMIKSAHFIPVKSTYIVEDYARLYIDDIVRWNGIHLSIISDRGAQFTSHLWRSFQKSLGTEVKLSTTFLRQIDGYQSSIGMAPFEVLCGRTCRCPVGWFKVGESSILDQEIIHEALRKVRVIRDRLATAYSRQKSYVDNRKRPLEFDVGNQIIMPPQRATRGHPSRRCVEPKEHELLNALKVQPQGEVINAEFHEAIRMLSQAVTNKVGQ